MTLDGANNLLSVQISTIILSLLLDETLKKVCILCIEGQTPTKIVLVQNNNNNNKMSVQIECGAKKRRL